VASLGLALDRFHTRRTLRKILDGTPPDPAPPGMLGDLAATVAKLQKDSENTLYHAAEELAAYRSLLDSINYGFLLLDHQLNITYFNRAFARIFPGTSPRRGRPLLEVVLDHRVAKVAREAIDSQRLQLLEIADVAAPGLPLRKATFAVEAAPLASARIGAAWLLLVDVTERNQTEQIRRDFVANASHELRTPLTLISGYLEALEDGLTEDPAATARAIEIMREHTSRILRIIEDMLTISHLEERSPSISNMPFDLSACARSAADHLAPLALAAEATITFDFPEDAESSIYRGDRFYFDQIFLNLIENAIKENHGRGVTITLSLRRSADALHLAVADDGVGIPAADQPYVFKRFYRASRHRHNKVKGTGLGLSIVRRAVEAHGGSISLKSKPGIATRFLIDLPIRDHGAPAPAGPQPLHPAP
jgi:two-component system, OmpR family, phosphate regulon sensor histidine kinase PhoR